MCIVVGVILVCLLLYSLFYFCMYGTCCCPGFGCFWCPPPAAAPPADDEPVKVRMRRPSGADSYRSSMRSTRSSCSHRDYDEGRKIVRINSSPSINGSTYSEQQPIIIQTVPAIQAPPIIQAAPMIQAAPQMYQTPQVYQAAPQIIQAAPAPAPVYNSGPSELKIVIGESRPANNTRETSANSVIVYDMAGRGGSSGGGITLGGGAGGLSLGGGGRSEYVLTSVDDGPSYKTSGALNEGFERDDGSFLSDGHRSAIIDIGATGGGFYPNLPRYDD